MSDVAAHSHRKSPGRTLFFRCSGTRKKHLCTTPGSSYWLPTHPRPSFLVDFGQENTSKGPYPGFSCFLCKTNTIQISNSAEGHACLLGCFPQAPAAHLGPQVVPARRALCLFNAEPRISVSRRGWWASTEHCSLARPELWSFWRLA